MNEYHLDCIPDETRQNIYESVRCSNIYVVGPFVRCL